MKKQRGYLWYLSAAVCLMAAWQMAAMAAVLPIVPYPFDVFVKLQAIFADHIAPHGFYSLWRIAAGMALAVLVGVPLGLAIGYDAKLDRFVSPLVYLTYPIPKIALLPILMLLLGLGETSKIVMIFLIIVFQVVLAVRDGVRSIPKEMFYPLYSLGAGFGAILREVLWQAVLPKFLTALRIALATSISVLFFTETFGTRYGMGYFIMDAWMRVNYLEMYAGIVVLSLIGLGLFGGIDWLEHRFCRWQMK